MTRTRLLLLFVVLAAVTAFFVSGASRWLGAAALGARLADLQALVDRDFPLAAAGFVAGYALLTALSLPVATVITLAGGAVFGLGWGTVLASVASSLGATLAMLLARFLLRDWVEQRQAGVAARINEGLAREGPHYLFALRLVPLFPFFAINLAMGLTRMPARTFWWVSQLGMLPGTLLYVNAGAELGAQFEAVAGHARVLSPGLVVSLALLGVFPLAARRALEAVRRRRALARFPRPARFDANLVVIGGGAAGLVSAYVAAAAQARVVLIEQDRMGGECLNRGCVPSKALLRSAHLAARMRQAAAFGLGEVPVRADFAAVMRRVRDVIARVEPHDSAERYAALGVECVTGHAVIRSPWAVEVDGRTITTRAIVVATGGEPALPPVAGLAGVPYLTSDDVWHLDALPARLVVLGGGPAGCELAQAFRRLGSAVTLVESRPLPLPREDADVGAALAASLRADGVEVLCDARAVAARPGALDVDVAGTTRTLAFDRLLVATGRRARTAGLGLEAVGVGLDADGTITVDGHLQTACPTIFACGDVAGPWQLTNAASHQGWYCATNALFGHLWRQRVGYGALPWAVYTEPEVARVGLDEAQARAQGTPVEVTRYDLADLDRAIVDGEAAGFVKVLTAAGTDRILGATVVGSDAGELISEFALALRHGLGLRKLLAVLHPYPTLTEANRFAAGAWQRAHLSPRLLALAARFHAWRR